MEGVVLLEVLDVAPVVVQFLIRRQLDRLPVYPEGEPFLYSNLLDVAGLDRRALVGHLRLALNGDRAGLSF